MFKAVFKLFFREIRLITTEHSLLLTLLGAPLLYVFMYGSIYINKVEENIGLAVIDEDRTELSKKLINEISSDPMIRTIPAIDLNSAQELMYRGKAEGYLLIEKDFEKKILALKQSNITLAVNASRFLPASDLTAHITNISLTVGGGVRKIYFNKQGMNDSQAMANTMPIQLDFKPLFNETTGYGSFLLPGLMAIILQQTLLIGLCLSMTIERKERKLGELKSISKNNVSVLLTGKGLFYYLSFMIFSQFFFLIAFSVFNMPFRGSLFEANLLMCIFFITLIPMGFLIGSFFKNPILVIQIMGFTSYPIFLITGYSMPFDSLPTAIQMISNLLPTTPFLRIYTMIVQGGASITDLGRPLIHLGALTLFYTILFIIRLKFLYKKQNQETVETAI